MLKIFKISEQWLLTTDRLFQDKTLSIFYIQLWNLLSFWWINICLGKFEEKYIYKIDSKTLDQFFQN